LTCQFEAVSDRLGAGAAAWSCQEEKTFFSKKRALSLEVGIHTRLVSFLVPVYGFHPSGRRIASK